MNNMNRGIILSLEFKILKLLGDIAENIANTSTRGCYLYLIYEPEFPEELLENSKKN